MVRRNGRQSGWHHGQLQSAFKGRNSLLGLPNRYRSRGPIPIIVGEKATRYLRISSLGKKDLSGNLGSCG
jgi:hypothetical protein